MFRAVLLVCVAFASSTRLLTKTQLETSTTAEILRDLPRTLDKKQQEVIVSKLEKEEEVIAKVVKRMTDQQKTKKHSTDVTESEIKNDKVKKARAEMKEWEEKMDRMQAKSRIGSVNVLSKLRNAIHLVKKGALSGNDKARNDLANVMKSMGQMAR